MKNIDVETAMQIAFIKLSGEEKERCNYALSKDIEHYEKMMDIDVSSVEPTFLLNTDSAFREDVVKPSLNRDELLKNAKGSSEDAFCVPKIVE